MTPMKKERQQPPPQPNRRKLHGQKQNNTPQVCRLDGCGVDSTDRCPLRARRIRGRTGIALINRWWVLLILYPTLTVPFCTWIIIGYFASIPKELDEAALIDGATWMQTARGRPQQHASHRRGQRPRAVARR